MCKNIDTRDLLVASRGTSLQLLFADLLVCRLALNQDVNNTSILYVGLFNRWIPLSELIEYIVKLIETAIDRLK